jgi:competence protein ComEC
MVDINTSQDYDAESFKELLIEERRKHPLVPFGSGAGLSGGYNSLLGMPATGGLATAFNSLLGQPPGYFEAMAESKRELQDPIDFMKQTYPGRRLWRFILTHPDLDHMRGLTRLYDSIGFDNFWDTRHTKPTPNYRSNDDKVDWEFYQRLRSGSLGLSPHFYARGDAYFAFARDEQGQPGGDWIEILSPTSDLVKTCNVAGKSNDLSLVLRLWHAGKSVILPGDAEGPAWDNMVDAYGCHLKSNFLKASHHGRDTGYHLDAMRLIAPLITFVSVGRKPDTDASSKYRQQCGRVASTRYHGNITLDLLDDGTYKWSVARNSG